MVEKPKKKGIAIIISVGGKPPKSPADTSTPDMKKYGANPMKKAWGFLKYGGPKGMDGLDDDGNYPQGKTEPINMQEYPAGSGRFMSLKDMMEARNAAARLALQKPAQPAPKPNAQNIMVNSKTGVYDPNDPEGWHPL